MTKFRKGVRDVQGRATGVVDAADEAEARGKAEWDSGQIKDNLDYRIEEIEEETLRRGVMLRPELQVRLLGASTEELTRVANELNEALTPMEWRRSPGCCCATSHAGRRARQRGSIWLTRSSAARGRCITTGKRRTRGNERTIRRLTT